MKYVVGPRDSRKNILSCMVFNPTVGRTADKDNDDEKQDDAEISPGLATRVLLSKGSPSSSV